MDGLTFFSVLIIPVCFPLRNEYKPSLQESGEKPNYYGRQQMGKKKVEGGEGLNGSKM